MVLQKRLKLVRLCILTCIFYFVQRYANTQACIHYTKAWKQMINMNNLFVWWWSLLVGVRTGAYALSNLKNWHSCQEYHLVDVWKQQENYEDSINVDQEQQEQNYNKTMHNMRNYLAKVHVCRNWVYLDARHDRKGVLADLEDYWPKLKHGGIMSGHGELYYVGLCCAGHV